MGELLSGFITYIGWGSGDIFGATVARKIGAVSTTFWVSVIGLVLFSLYIPWTLSTFHLVTVTVVIQSLGLGILFVLGNILINEALILSSVSLVGAILASVPILSMVFSLIFFKDSVSLIQWVIIGVVFFGVFLCTVNFDDLKKRKKLLDNGVVLALVAAFFVSLYFTFLRIPMMTAGWYWPIFFSYCMVPMVMIYMKIRKVAIVPPLRKGVMLPLLLCIIALRGADISFNVGLSLFGSSGIAPIAGAYPSLFLILSFLFFNDPISFQQKIGIFITVSAVVVFSLLPLFTG